MATAKKPKPFETTTDASSVDEPRRHLSVGLAKQGRGYVAYSLITEGNLVVERHIHSEPLPLEYAAQALKTVILTRVVRPGTRLYEIETDD